jgi:hypothetical protein
MAALTLVGVSEYPMPIWLLCAAPIVSLAATWTS